MVPLFPGRRLLAHPFDECGQFGGFSQLIDARVQGSQGFIGKGRVDHAVALGTNQLHVFLSAAFFPGQAVVFGQALLVK